MYYGGDVRDFFLSLVVAIVHEPGREIEMDRQLGKNSVEDRHHENNGLGALIVPRRPLLR